MKLFIWWLIQNIISTTDNLRYKGIQLANIYCVCGGNGESSIHAMFDCPLSRFVWASVYPKLSGNAMRLSVSSNFWFKVLEMLKRDGAVKKFMLLIWKNWNKCLYEQICSSLKSSMSSVNKLMADYREVNRRKRYGMKHYRNLED